MAVARATTHVPLEPQEAYDLFAAQANDESTRSAARSATPLITIPA